MGCKAGKALDLVDHETGAQGTEAACAGPTATAEQKAVDRLKLLFDTLEKSKDGTTSADELQAAIQKDMEFPEQPGFRAYNDKVFIQSLTGLYLEERYGNVGLHKDKSGWQQWVVEPAGSHKVYLTNHKGQQLEDKQGKIGCIAGKTQRQKWDIDSAGDGRVFFSSHRRQQLTEHKGKPTIAAGKVAAAGWIVTKVDGGTPAYIEEGKNLQELVKEAGLNEKYNAKDLFGPEYDGRVTWEEFLAHLTKVTEQWETTPLTLEAVAGAPAERALAQLRQLYDSLDANKDGAISKIELSTALNKNDSLGSLIEEAGFNKHYYVLEALDTNADGKITWDEFEQHLRAAAKEEVAQTGQVAAAAALPPAAEPDVVQQREEQEADPARPAPKGVWCAC